MRNCRLLVVAVACLAATLTGCGGSGGGKSSSEHVVPPFSHVVVIVFENKEANEIFGNPQAPTFNRLAKRYAVLSRYTGIAHPSLPNYIALVSGSTYGIHSDCLACRVDARSLADTLEEAGRSWKLYAEGLPSIGFAGAYAGHYARRHVPFLYFRRVLARRSRIARVVPLTRLQRDLATGSLPDFSLVIPDTCNDMHDCPIATGDTWLKRTLPPLLASKELRDGVVFVVFDEGRSGEGGGGRIPALALGPLVERGARMPEPMSHYGLLRTVEDAFGLPRLGESAEAQPIIGIWRQ